MTDNDDEIVYYCELCAPGDEYRSSGRSDVKRHISMLDDDTHGDHKGNDPNVIGEILRRDIETLEANRRSEHDGEERVKISVDNKSYEGPSGGINLAGEGLQTFDERPVKSPPQRQAGEVVTDVETDNKVAVLLDAGDWARVLGAEGMPFRVREKIVSQLAGLDGSE